MNKRIMICGASGTGKTTLAEHISELYELPFVSTSAKEVWPKFGFKDHAESHRISTSDPVIGIKYQNEILARRIKALQIDSYITDRSLIDNMAYLMLELGHSLSCCETSDFIYECNMAMEKCDGLIYLKWVPEIILEDDGFRIQNPYYQDMVDNIISWVINGSMLDLTCPVLTLDFWDFEKRIKIVDTWIKRL